MQSDIKVLLLAAPFNLDEGNVIDQPVFLELRPAGPQDRCEMGSTVIKVKKDLTVGNVLSASHRCRALRGHAH